MSEHEPSALEAHDEHEAMNLWVITGYLVALTIATSFTLVLQRFAFWNTPTNMLFVLMVSFCKASLVVGFFMHFRYERLWKYFLCVPPCVMAVIMVLALLPDIASLTEGYEKVSWNSR